MQILVTIFVFFCSWTLEVGILRILFLVCFKFETLNINFSRLFLHYSVGLLL